MCTWEALERSRSTNPHRITVWLIELERSREAPPSHQVASEGSCEVYARGTRAAALAGRPARGASFRAGPPQGHHRLRAASRRPARAADRRADRAARHLAAPRVPPPGPQALATREPRQGDFPMRGTAPVPPSRRRTRRRRPTGVSARGPRRAAPTRGNRIENGLPLGAGRPAPSIVAAATPPRGAAGPLGDGAARPPSVAAGPPPPHRADRASGARRHARRAARSHGWPRARRGCTAPRRRSAA